MIDISNRDIKNKTQLLEHLKDRWDNSDDAFDQLLVNSEQAMWIFMMDTYFVQMNRDVNARHIDTPFGQLEYLVKRGKDEETSN